MECVQNLLLGDPVYDERGQLVRREYGLKNALALFVLGYVAYTLYISMGKKVFSGKREGRRKGKMKGGGGSGSDGDADSNPDGEADGGSSRDKSKVEKFFAHMTAGRWMFLVIILLIIIVFAESDYWIIISHKKPFLKIVGVVASIFLLIIIIMVGVYVISSEDMPVTND